MPSTQELPSSWHNTRLPCLQHEDHTLHHWTPYSVTVASITVVWQPNNSFTPINHWATNNLPDHVKGAAFWIHHNNRQGGYYYTKSNQQPAPVELINNAWHLLHYSTTEQIFGVWESYQVEPGDPSYGLGYWHEHDPQHPNYQPTQVPQIQTTNLTAYWAPSPTVSESESDCPQSVQSQHTWGPNTAVPIDVNQSATNTGPLDAALVAALDPIISLQGSLPLDPPSQPTVSVNVTTTTPANNPPSNGGMQGVPPAIFNGTCSHTDKFWAQFRWYKLVNCTHCHDTQPIVRIWG